MFRPTKEVTLPGTAAVMIVSGMMQLECEQYADSKGETDADARRLLYTLICQRVIAKATGEPIATADTLSSVVTPSHIFFLSQEIFVVTHGESATAQLFRGLTGETPSDGVASNGEGVRAAAVNVPDQLGG